MASANPYLSALFGRVLRLTSLTTLGIAVIGGVAGWFIKGTDGVLSAAIGAAMGGWLLKLVLFLGLTVALRNATFLVRPLFFFTVVAAILGSLVVDALVAAKARIPAVGQ